MSDRTEKAHKALADALDLPLPKVEEDSYERQYILLRVAEVQAQIAQAEAMETLAEWCKGMPWQPGNSPMLSIGTVVPT